MEDTLFENGTVGCGGAGFPASVKLAGHVETLIVNAAECEPLLHKDKELLVRRGDEFFAGLAEAMRRVTARRGIIALKKKYADLASSVAKRCPSDVEVHLLDDVYPAGDEFVLVYEVTGRIIGPGGLPKDVDAVVQNVETLVNIGLARPVTRKALTVAGLVARPMTLEVPVGAPFADILAAAGGALEPDFGVLVGGVMMGRLAGDLSEPVTKTTAGLIVLPIDHPLLRRHARRPEAVRRIARAACDQCTFCTELCPRYLLNHPVEPHRVMRSFGLGISADGAARYARYCSGCRLCSLATCPEGLDPSEICGLVKNATAQGSPPRGESPAPRPHPLRFARRMPTARLVRKLGLEGMPDHAPWSSVRIAPRRVQIPLRQHVGVAAEPVVRVGQTVSEGDCIGRIPAGKLGAPVHASIDGRVVSVADTVVIEAE
ncbi:MAG: 4Fe-4S dicluster domain-containing protein [Acidobacteriota bacterium]|nr:4Fe-4S dicluster domain-containing protein [Acidobacteriota bacterium]